MLFRSTNCSTWRRLIACTLVLMVTACGDISAPTPTPSATSLPSPVPGDPRAYVLQPEDVPDGFALDPKASGPDSNQDVAQSRVPRSDSDPAETLATLEAQGRIAGYTATYSRPAGLMLNAIIGSKVAIFRTPEGAHRYMRDLIDTVWPATGYRPQTIAMPPLGDESQAFRDDYNTRLMQATTTYLVYFRVGAIVCAAWTTDLTANESLDTTLKYARLMEARARSFGR